MKDHKSKSSKITLSGFLFTFSSFIIWGILPVYWKSLNFISAAEILSHRVLWSFIFIIITVITFKQHKYLSDLKNIRKLILIIISGLLLGLNWFLFIYSVNTGQILQASLGYYINPLFSILLGIFFLKEKLNILQTIALILAAIGVLFLTLDYGKFPYLALSMTVSFALYGYVKKLADTEPLFSLMIETLILLPIAGAYLFFNSFSKGESFFNLPVGKILLIISSGIVTSLPLYLFAQGVRRINLSTVGFLQYITPTLMLLIGIFIYKEEFHKSQIICFSFIWAGLILYSITLMSSKKKNNLIIEENF